MRYSKLSFRGPKILLICCLVFWGCTDQAKITLPNVSGLKAIPGDSSIILQWSVPVGVKFSHFEIRFTPTNGISQPIIVTPPSSVERINGLKNGTEYTFVLLAKGLNGRQSKSIGIKSTPVASPPKDTTSPKDTVEPNSGTFIDERDGQKYKWVKIGDQIWMAQNLNYIPKEDTFSAVSSGSNIKDFTRHYYIYGFDKGGDPALNSKATTNRAKYGILYNWYAAIGLPDNIHDTTALKKYLKDKKIIRGIAPEGWHIPSDSEYMVLEQYLGMQESELVKTNYRGMTAEVGKKLKASVDWKANNGIDKFGFGLLPSGRWKNGQFQFLGEYAYLWTSTLSKILIKDGRPQVRAWLRYAKYNIKRIGRFDFEHFNGYAIRCIKDE